MEKNAILSAQQLGIGYGKGVGAKFVQENLALDLYPGELTCLLGPNGAGKSTLLRTLGASQPLLRGEITLNGISMNSYSEKKLSREIGLVLTERTTAGGLTVSEMVALGRHPHTGFFGRLGGHDNEVINAAIASVGIAEKRSQFIAELSDGERQKVMIAKALAQECPVVLLDEPTAFLDVVSRIEIMALLHDLAVKQHKTILLSTHDLEQALLMADRLWLMSREDGLRCGNTEDLVLSGAMDTLFRHRDITFDRLTGNYRPLPALHQMVEVEASDELFYWAKNAFMRNRYKCVALGEGKALCRVKILSPQEIIVSTPESDLTVTSFGEMISVVCK